MTRTVTLCFCLVLLLGLTLAYRHSRAISRPGGSSEETITDPAETAEVLPAVSDVWSNLNAHASVPSRTTQAEISAAVPVQAATNAAGLGEAAPSPDLVGARAKDLLARVALDSLGVDPDAEQFWLAAINDPNLAAEERRDLIQSMDEAGFADPKHITTDDLPLIASRIALIEEVAPNAMDNVNAAAFQETYRDLLNMFASVTAAVETPADGALPPAPAPGAGQ